MKQNLITYGALMMAIFYLAHPMHGLLSTLFHEVSHVLSRPVSITNHQEHHHHHNHHHAHSHLEHAPSHEHHFIEIFDTFFEGIKTQDNTTPIALNLFELDKHFFLRNWNLWYVSIDLRFKIFPFSIEKLIEGHPRKLFDPPRETSV